MTNRREFILGAGALAGCAISNDGVSPSAEASRFTPVTAGKTLKISATFLDEISDDIPHQNWGYDEWERDFLNMKAIGIDTVVMIRCAQRRFMAYPSKYLESRGFYRPRVDLVEMFLTLADKHGLKFYFGTASDCRCYTAPGGVRRDPELDTNLFVTEEAWKAYGHHPSFRGWYLSNEISRRNEKHMNTFRKLGRHCKDLSGGLPVLMSPCIDGVKAIPVTVSSVHRKESITVAQHEIEWNEIFDAIHESVDQCAFQDGHVDFNELPEFLAVNRKLTDKYGMQCWTNTETFDRDMPIKFLPIKFEKLLLKLDAASRCNYDKVITFEFSHFMSPQSVYLAAGNLYRRYREYFGI